MFVVEGRPWVFWMRVLLRFLQFALSLVALVTLSAAFVSTSYYSYSSMLSSSAVIYTTLITYTGMVIGLWYLLAILLMRMCGRPLLMFEQIMDFLLALMLLIAAIVLLTHDYVQHCSVYGYMLRCRSLRTAVVFTFLAMAAFLASLLLSFCELGKDHDNNDNAHHSHAQTDMTHRTTGDHVTEGGPAEAPYVMDTTPTAHTKPHNHSHV